MPAINLYITCCSNCTTRTLHIPKPAKPSLSLKMRSRSSSPGLASSPPDPTAATPSGLILQICLIMALSLCCKRCRFVLASGQASLAWSMALRTQELYTWPQVPAHQARPGLHSVVCRQQGGHPTCTVLTYNQDPASVVAAHCTPHAPKVHSHRSWRRRCPLMFDRQPMGTRPNHARGPGLHHRSWLCLSCVYPQSPPPRPPSISRASWHIPLGSHQWRQDHPHTGPPREHHPETRVTRPLAQWWRARHWARTPSRPWPTPQNLGRNPLFIYIIIHSRCSLAWIFMSTIISWCAQYVWEKNNSTVLDIMWSWFGSQYFNHGISPRNNRKMAIKSFVILSLYNKIHLERSPFYGPQTQHKKGTAMFHS